MSVHRRGNDLPLVIILFFYFVGSSSTLVGQPYGIDTASSIGKFLNDSLPNHTPNENGVSEWEVVNAFPNLTFNDPLDMRELPGNKLLVASKNGFLWTFDNDPNASTKTLFLDISDRVKTTDDGNVGIFGAIMHPEYGQTGSPNQFVYIVYRHLHEDIFNMGYARLSRFSVSNGVADPNSEFIMINQFDGHDWHNGGSMFFGPQDGFLYISVGDEGSNNDQFNSAQTLEKGLFSGILRIDVDRRGGAISHPIRRQTTFARTPPAGWPASYTQGYYIPNDNPWLAPDSSHLEEYYALGFRSCHRMTYDEPTGDIWIGDVGQASREEVSIIRKGDNAQWPYKEGLIDGQKPKPNPVIGNEKPPLFDMTRDEAHSVIGGIVYRGGKWSQSLNGKYIFATHKFQTIYSVDYYNTGSAEKTLMTTIPFLTSDPRDGPVNVFKDQAGDVFFCHLMGNKSEGLIYKLNPVDTSTVAVNAPNLLSQTGAFSDLSTLTPTPGVVPFEPNVTFWSDGALKSRWIALPNDGTHDAAEEQIQFSENEEWAFPNGTVFIKHFDLLLDETDPNSAKKIETRFTVKGEDGQYYYLTYRWLEDESDAELVTGGADRIFTIQTATGSRQQTWRYPNDNECKSCHFAGGGLGMNTRQMNGDYTYSGGVTDNQLRTMNHLNWFTSSLNEGDLPTYLKVSSISDTTATLEQKALSYLDVNCGYCHQPGALQVNMDFRMTTPLDQKQIMHVPPEEDLGIAGAKRVYQGDHSRSVIFHRIASLESGVMMPPLAKSLVDSTGRNLIRDWINSLDPFIDSIAPSIPVGLVASDVQSTQLTMGWNASSDNVGVSGYQVFQDGNPQPIDTVVGLEITITGLNPETTYSFAIAALDTSGNVSNQSATLQVQTLSEGPCNGTVSNLALNKIASQSSTYGVGHASLAIDGNTQGSSPWSADLQHTQAESEPWWEVDLGQSSNIQQVNIYNRSDCCQNRVRDFYILGSNEAFSPTDSLSDLINSSSVTAHFVAGQIGAVGNIILSLQARYIRIQLTSQDIALHMAEVEIMGCASDTTDPCSGTEAVVITPAGPFTTDQGIQQLVANPLAGTWSGSADSNGNFDPSQGVGLYDAIYTVDFGNGCVKADTLQIEVTETDTSGICSTSTNLALNQVATQSSTYGGGLASLAVDGDTTGNSPWSANLQHTQTEYQPWWEVDLGQQSDIDQVNIYNRSDCCQNRVRDFYILVSDAPFSPTDSLSEILNSPQVAVHFVAGQIGVLGQIPFEVSGRYVRIQLTNPDLMLHMAEVEVMGCPNTTPDPCEGTESVAITPAGPFMTDQGIQQLVASPIGGTWSGSADSNGNFDPSVGAGSYSVIYTVDFGNGCVKADTITIEVNDPSDPCSGTETVVITPVGPFTTDQGIQQLVASPLGGTWSGSADTNGNFDPSVGAGSYSVIYTVDFGNGCINADTLQLGVTEADTGACTTPINLALNQSVSQSSTYGGGLASLAVDGDTTGNSPWSANLQHTQTEYQPWWEVDLGQQSDIDQVNIYNRSNCCQNRVRDFYILVSDAPISPTDSLSELLNSPQVTAHFVAGQIGALGEIPFEVSGRYVRIQLTNPDLMLHMAEVEVMGCPNTTPDPCEGTESVAITPAGPFMTDQGIQQLVASPIGGTWSGSADTNGNFDPSVGAGSYSVIYAVDFGNGCVKADTTTIEVNDPSDPCSGTETVVITPTGPFTTDQGIQQLVASPSGGTWSGLADSNGNFDPSIGSGSYSVIYTVDFGNGCVKADTLQVEVTEADTGACTTPINLALNQPASQSSTYGGGVASIAVDGNTTGASPWSADLQHTQPESEPWWEVDLGQQSDIQYINIYNRSDCCQNRVRDFYIFVSSMAFSPTSSLNDLLNSPQVSAHFVAGQIGTMGNIPFPVTGRYVRIQLTSASQVLHMAEVEVMGCPSGIIDPCEGTDTVMVSPVGPFAIDQGIQQLAASPSGGIWSGAAAANGSFDPSQGTGFYNVIYTVDFGNGCIQADTTTIEVNDPTDPCLGTGEVQITPAGPFTADQGSQQLAASPTGGSWSGAVDTTGVFDPSMGAGSYSVVYTVDFGNGCVKADTSTFVVEEAGTCISPTNLALNQAANQSSTYGAGVATLAVDGNTSGTSPWTADLQHTQTTFQPWWEVDLGQQADIEQINIYNRSDCCQGRIRDFYVLVSNEAFSPTDSLTQLLNSPTVSAHFVEGQIGAVGNIPLTVSGRFVRIQLTNNSQTLHMAEVEVMGCFAPSSGTRFSAANEAFDPESVDVRKPQILTFPNPTSREKGMKVWVSIPENQPVALVLYNMEGKRVFTQRIEGVEEATLPISTTSLPAGIYVIRLSGPDWNVSERVLIR